MVTARIFTAMEEQLEHRNMHFRNRETDKWTTVLHNGYHNALMQISRVTTGRFTCGANFASFEDERDAMVFKLANRE